ncbi:MAG: hypothetical protein IPM29_31170 [Planctomycetes bacterium]|nr:hypothetical protein [Planctomycetota bacterium]
MRSLTRSWLGVLLTAVLATAQSPLVVSGVPAGAPFRIAASASGTALSIELELASEWHGYARDVGGGEPVRLTLDATCGFAAAGDLVAPDRGDGVLAGSVRLTLPIRATRDPAGGASRELRATLALQVCDALQCLEPMSLQLHGEVPPLSVLLVVAARDERAERIAGFLRARGFAAAVDTYAEVTADVCEAHDVVIADAERHGVGIGLLRQFPRTSSPLIGIGFAGTEIIEAHGLAMTSGYI